MTGDHRVQSPTADDILRQMKNAYADCSTYRDQGEVVVVFDPGKPNSFTQVQLFFTLFIRPDRFRFEFRARRRTTEPSWKRDAIVACGPSVAKYSNWHEKESCDSVHLAIAAFTGVSNSSANTVPTMLMPKPIRAVDRSSSYPCSVVGKEEINAELCDIVEQRGPFDSQRRLWIVRETRLLRRVEQTFVITRARMAEMNRREEEMLNRANPRRPPQPLNRFPPIEHPPFTVNMTTLYRQVVVNAPIEAEEFERDLPQEGLP